MQSRSCRYEDLQPGDQVRRPIPGTLHGHDAIYTGAAGDYAFIHYAGQNGSKHHASVRFASRQEYTDGERDLNRITYPGVQPVTPEEIIRRVLSRLGESSYSLLGNNCDQLCIWARYPTHYQTLRDQVSSTLVGGGLLLGLCGLMVASPLCIGAGILGLIAGHGRSRSSRTQRVLW
jgi:hypothetical protein